jgi:hypothetical protein
MLRSYLLSRISCDGHEEALLRAACRAFFGFRSRASGPARRGCHRCPAISAALVVEREAVGLHVIEKHLVGAAGAGACVNSRTAVDTPAYGLKTPEGIEITPSSLWSVDQELADGSRGAPWTSRTGRRRARSPRRGRRSLQDPQDQRDEQQLGLLGASPPASAFLATLLGSERALEGRVGEHQRVLVGLWRIRSRACRLRRICGLLDPVQ